MRRCNCMRIISIYIIHIHYTVIIKYLLEIQGVSRRFNDYFTIDVFKRKMYTTLC